MHPLPQIDTGLTLRQLQLYLFAIVIEICETVHIWKCRESHLRLGSSLKFDANKIRSGKFVLIKTWKVKPRKGLGFLLTCFMWEEMKIEIGFEMTRLNR